MKKIIIILFLSVFLFSCNEKKNKIEIIPNIEKGFLDEKSITEPAIPVEKNFEENLRRSLREIVETWYERNDKEDGFYSINIKLFIDETGKVVMLQDISALNLARIGMDEKTQKRMPAVFNSDSQILNDIANLAEDWEFTPANFMGVNVKYQKVFNQYYRINSEAEDKIKLVRENLDFSFDIMSKYFVAVEEMPNPIGGIEAIQNKIVYPPKAKKAGVEGRIFIRAYIDENGNVAKTEILKGIDDECDEVAAQAVKSTKFIPGKQRGKAVKVQVSVPILFKLSDKTSK